MFASMCRHVVEEETAQEKETCPTKGAVLRTLEFAYEPSSDGVRPVEFHGTEVLECPERVRKSCCRDVLESEVESNCVGSTCNGVLESPVESNCIGRTWFCVVLESRERVGSEVVLRRVGKSIACWEVKLCCGVLESAVESNCVGRT